MLDCKTRPSICSLMPWPSTASLKDTPHVAESEKGYCLPAESSANTEPPLPVTYGFGKWSYTSLLKTSCQRPGHGRSTG
jgi:hypothetical protein